MKKTKIPLDLIKSYGEQVYRDFLANKNSLEDNSYSNAMVAFAVGEAHDEERFRKAILKYAKQFKDSIQKEAKNIIKRYESEQLNKSIVISSICSLNRDPNECSVNLYTENGCKTCRYFKKKT